MDSEIKTVHQLVNRMAETRGEAVFLVSPESARELTFKGLQEQASGLSGKLREMGLEKGDKVAFLLDNGLFTAQLFLGTMYGGFVVVPLNVRAGPSQLSYTLDHCDAKVVFVADEYHQLINEVLTEIRRPIQVIFADVHGFVGGCETSIEGNLLPTPEPEDVALLMYTSGSTGQPRGAVHSHRSVLAGARNSIAAHLLSPADRSLLVLPLYHINAECVTLVPALLSGGSVVVPHRFFVNHFWDWLDEYRCTWSALVPTIVSQLLNWEDARADSRTDAFRRIRFLRSSSAPLSPSLHRAFLDRFPLLLIQAMGSTEAGNIFSNPLPPCENKIGSPGLPWGFEVKIVNRAGIELPPGESGEVLVRGPAVMQGYYKEPEGTAAALCPDGWLHTGDLAYRDQDGYFFVVGRSKELVIKGGVNIAPRQIDEVLESHPSVLEAAAVGVPDRYLGEDLVAFVVLRAGIVGDERELLTFCESHLGHFKTPSRIHFVRDLPKGPSGKVQRLRLLNEAARPAVATFTSSGSEVALMHGDGRRAHNGLSTASSPIEQVIAEVWLEFLEEPKVGVQDNFFALGGNSLLAIQCLSRLREKLPIALSLSDFFENATVAQQAALVRQRLSLGARNNGDAPADQSDAGKEQAQLQQLAPLSGPEAIPRRDRALPCPLSPAQQRLWFLEQLNPGVPVYNESEAVRLKGEFNADAMESALNAIISRHEILRTTIQAKGEQVIATAHESWPLRFKKIDLRHLPAERQDAEVERFLVEEPRHPFDLEAEPGLRATVIQLAAEVHVFILMVHHIICDRLSLGVLWREAGTLYEAFLRGEPSSLPPLPNQYGDYATWQQQQIQTANFEQDLTFWKENLRGAPKLLELPTDRPRPRVTSYLGVKRQFRLGPALAKGVRDLSRREQTSLFTVFAATLNVLLYRYSGQDDILVGIPIADRDWPELQPLIGFFVDTHVLRTDLTGNPTFHELLGRVKRAVVGVYSHRALPFAQVIETLKPERNLSYSPLFQVMLNWRDRGSQLQFVGLTRLILEPLLAQSMTSKFDLTIFLTDAVDDIWLEIEYSTELFDDARIERMVGHLRTLLEGVLADADRPISELPLLTDPERQQILFDWNQTEVAYPKDQCLHELIEEQGERTPDAVAVVFEDTQLTYWQLNERANQLALLLRRLGVGPNTLVGIYLERSLEMVVGLLGVLKAGAAYVPLDPTYPRERLAFMLRDSGAAILLTQAQLADSVPGHQARIIRLDADWPAIAAYPSMSVESKVTSRDPAYVVYTSGSTGNPKGVQIPHRALVNFLCAMRGNPGVTAMDTLLAITTLSFDIAGLELWLPLIVGARVVIADRGTTLDGQALAELLDHCGATILQATPTTWRLLLAGGWRGNPRLKILCGGEPWPTELARQLLEKCDSLWNMYGPTETTIWSAVCRINPEEDVLIGAPIANTQLYVLDPHLQPVPVGVPGELCIGGDGLASGYLRHPELTADKFPPNPFCDEPRGRIYKTGDLVRFRADGKIEFLGRLDHQVKVRGFRIELGEIETVLSRHPDVKTAAVLASEANTGDQRLIAYVVPNHDNEALDNPEADAERISVWQAIWDNTYNSPRPPEDPSFNIAGWRSSYDGQPIPDEEMREWVDDSVRRILALQPKHVLDLGCGTGLLLFRLAPHCDRYCGLDFSATALGSIRQELGSQKQCHAEVTLLQRRADDLEDLETESFDAVILNSVVQYFPNIDYLVRVLERASRAVKPGGFIFLGDVRNLHLWKAFCSSVQLYQAPAELPLAELRQRIRQQMSQEEELLIAPEFFLEVKQHLPSISDVEIQLKRGHYHNEVTLFRYDVILHFGSSPRANGGLESWDWQQKKVTLPALQDHLEQNQPSLLHVRAIPNERLQRELKVLEWLDCNDQPATVSELREAVEAASLEPGVEPENLWKLGELLSYSVEITWSDPTRLGSCDAIFRRRDNGQIADSPTLWAGRKTGSAKPWISYANRPLQGSRARNLIPSLRDYLKGTMPEYMLPSDYILLDAMPLTPNGKLDRKALPAPDSGRPDLEVAYVPPRTPVEVVMARLWAEVLGVERVGIHDNFFELGGHSLLATQIISRLRRVFDLELPLRSLFEAPTVAFLTESVERMRWAVESQEATSSPDSGSGGETALVEELI